MPITWKPNAIRYRDPEDGTYKGVDVIAERTTSEQVAELQSAGTTQVNRVTAAGTSAVAHFPETADACDTLSTDFAPAYVGNQAYHVGDLCTYQYQLYQCTVEIPANQDATFVPGHWASYSVSNVKQDILTRYTGVAPSVSILELPDNCWWLVAGDVLRTLLGDTFLWLDDIRDSASWYYRVNVIRVSTTMRRFEIGGAGSFIRWAGYILADQSEITWYSDYPDTTLTETHVPADAKTVGDNVLLKYEGDLPANIIDLPRNSWVVGYGSDFTPIMGESFTWPLTSGTVYILKKYRVSDALDRYELCSIGRAILYVGWKSIATVAIAWTTNLPDTTLSLSGVPADAETVGDNVLLKYTGIAPTTSITELPDNSWWVATGEVLQPLLGPNFVWTLTSTSNHIVKKILVVGIIRRYEIVSVGGTVLWAGYSTTGNITWSTTNIFDVIENSETIMLTKRNNVQAGITWEWQSDGSCKVWGTATGTSINNIVPASDLPPFLHATDRIDSGVLGKLIPGDKVEFKYTTTNNDIVINVYWSDGTNVTYETVKNGYGILTIPRNKSRWGVRLYVASGVEIPQSSPAVVSNIQITKFCKDEITGGGTINSKFLGFGHSTMTGSVWILPQGSSTPVYSHLCTYDDSPYAGIASGLGVRQENVDYTLISSTAFMMDANKVVDAYYCFKNCILRTDLHPYDYVLLTLTTGDIRYCPLGDMNSVAGDGSVVGGVLEVIDYARNNINGNPLCTPVICSSIPYMHPEDGYDIFTTPIQGPSGVVTLADMDEVMHQLAKREHCIYIDFQDMWLSYHWYEYTPTQDNVHLTSDRGYRIISEYLRRKVVG